MRTRPLVAETHETPCRWPSLVPAGSGVAWIVHPVAAPATPEHDTITAATAAVTINPRRMTVIPQCVAARHDEL